mgnify:CR=1 FL=1
MQAPVLTSAQAILFMTHKQAGRAGGIPDKQLYPPVPSSLLTFRPYTTDDTPGVFH